MIYLSHDNIIKAYCNNAESTSNKFWGVLGILQGIGASVKPGISYQINPNITAGYLQDLFCSGDKREFKDIKTTYYVIFSKNWLQKLCEIMCPITPNILDIAVWHFRHHAFSTKPSTKELIQMFMNDTGLNSDQLNTLFDFNHRNLEYSVSEATDKEILNSLSRIFGNPQRYNSISAEGSFIKANPGEFSRAPFIQTIYAAHRSSECLLFTQFDILNAYYLKPIKI